MKARYFKSGAEFRAWLAKNHAAAGELLVGFYKKETGKPSMTWLQSVDEALCYGWIDGIRRTVDEARYTIRFTPRRARSIWSAVNIRRVGELIEAGRMQPAGLQAFQALKENRSRAYSYEKRKETLDPPYATKLARNQTAWKFYQAQPPSYRRAINWWVLSAKKEETRLKRLHELIALCEQGRRHPRLTRPQKAK